MMTTLLAKKAPLLATLTLSTLLGCGEAPGELRRPLTERKAAAIEQADFDTIIDEVKLRDCSFVVSGGVATFTPSSELSQAIFGDPDGSAHRITFPVPVIGSGAATVEIRSLAADFVATGLRLSGSTATLTVAFRGQLHVTAQVPLLGRLPADVELRPSSLAASLIFDTAAQRARVSSVVSRIDPVTRNCGGTGWCNRIFDNVLRANLPTWIEAPLRDAANGALDDPDRTENIEDAMVFLYNRKDPQATPWTLVPTTLELSTGAFRFQAERTLP